MTSDLTKAALLESLPVSEGDLTVRPLTREDVALLAAWPSYPASHAGFNLKVRNSSPEAQERFWTTRCSDPNRVYFALDHEPLRAIGLLIFSEVDWEKREMETMGVRIHPDFCDKGVGTRAMRLLGLWALRQGLNSLRLDVSALNVRAVRCYEKAGFEITGELWRDAQDLKGVDLSAPENAHLKPHFRLDGYMPQTRFWWMEMR